MQLSEVGPTYDGPGSKLSCVPVLCIPLDHILIIFVALLSSYARICNYADLMSIGTTHHS